MKMRKFKYTYYSLTLFGLMVKNDCYEIKKGNSGFFIQPISPYQFYHMSSGGTPTYY